MKQICFALAVLFLSANAYAAHPLITDDTWTQGKGKFEFELNGEWGRETRGGRVDSGQLATAIACGVAEKVDLLAGIPFVMETPEGGDTTHGVADITVELKWNIYKLNMVNLAIKPGVIFPSGDASRGFGNGEVGYQGYIITTIEPEPFYIHLNAGYIRNGNNLGDREDLWHFSVAVEYWVIDNLGILTNVGSERNPDPAEEMHPVFFIAGLIWSPLKDLDFDLGYKIGLSDPEADHTLMAGITVRW